MPKLAKSPQIKMDKFTWDLLRTGYNIITRCNKAHRAKGVLHDEVVLSLDLEVLSHACALQALEERTFSLVAEFNFWI